MAALEFVMRTAAGRTVVGGLVGAWLGSCGWAGSASARQATVNPEAAMTPAGQPRAAPAAATPGWWNRTVFYEIFVRSFKDSTAGPLAGDGIGDIAGLIEKLDYLNDGDPATTGDLGVTGLWLMPIQQSPSYHGYDTTDYFTVESDYGTNEDFKRLMTECHRRGIRVVIDLVLNHHSNKHPWFQSAIDPAAANHDWYIWSDADPGWRGPWNERVWHPVQKPNGEKAWYYGIFSHNMPDLNYRTPAVTEAMHRVSAFWLKDMDADGFRLDAIRHLIEHDRQQENTPETLAWLEEFRSFYKGVRTDAFTVGEVWGPTPTIAQYVGTRLDSCFEFELAAATVEAVRTGAAGKLRAKLDEVWTTYPTNQFCTFLANHDQTRVMTQLHGDAKQAALAATVQFMLPGIPFVYYGEELGLTGDKPDEQLRTPMPWTASEPLRGFSTVKPWEAFSGDPPTVSVAAESDKPDSLLNLYRTLIRLRDGEAALREGGYLTVVCPNPAVLSFLRTGPDGRAVLVVANLSGTSVSDYTLSVDEPPASATPPANVAFAATEVLHKEPVTPPTGGGGFGLRGAAYQPFKVLPPRTVYVVRLGRA